MTEDGKLPAVTFIHNAELRDCLERQAWRCLCGQPMEPGAAVLTVIRYDDRVRLAAVHGECGRAADIARDASTFAKWVGASWADKLDRRALINIMRRAVGLKPDA